MSGFGVGVVNELCAFTPSEEDVGLEEDEGDTKNGKEDAPMTGDPRGGAECQHRVKAGADEQASPGTVTVAVESNRMVTTSSVPMAVNANEPLHNPDYAELGLPSCTRDQTGEKVRQSHETKDRPCISIKLPTLLTPKTRNILARPICLI